MVVEHRYKHDDTDEEKRKKKEKTALIRRVNEAYNTLKKLPQHQFQYQIVAVRKHEKYVELVIENSTTEHRREQIETNWKDIYPEYEDIMMFHV